MVDGLAQAVAQNHTALLALTALKDYDNYTFTHMVNVSILTMGQARALGIDGVLLRGRFDVFHEDEREFYRLENLWRDAPVVPWDQEAEVPSR